MAEYKGDPIVLSVTMDDIPNDYTPEEHYSGIELWLCGECFFHNREEWDKCHRCDTERRIDDTHST